MENEILESIKHIKNISKKKVIVEIIFAKKKKINYHLWGPSTTFG